jgi:hypothetical protein
MAKDDNKIAALAMIQGIIDSATELAAVASAMEREPAQPDILFADANPENARRLAGVA